MTSQLKGIKVSRQNRIEVEDAKPDGAACAPGDPGPELHGGLVASSKAPTLVRGCGGRGVAWEDQGQVGNARIRPPVTSGLCDPY